MATRVVFSEQLLARLRGFPEMTRAELIRYFTLTSADEGFVAGSSANATCSARACSCVRCRGPGSTRAKAGGGTGPAQVHRIPVRAPGPRPISQLYPCDLLRRRSHAAARRRTVAVRPLMAFVLPAGCGATGPPVETTAEPLTAESVFNALTVAAFSR